MSKRLQVVMRDEDLQAYERAARGAGVSLSEWVRQALRTARQATSQKSPDRKLAAIRVAARHRFPAPDIDRMLAEIEQGYVQESAG